MEENQKSKNILINSLNSKNKIGTILTLMIIGLLLSIFVLPVLLNPFYLFLSISFIPLLGDVGTIIFLFLMLLFISIFFFENKETTPKLIYQTYQYSKKKKISKILFILSLTFFISTISILVKEGNITFQAINLKTAYTKTGLYQYSSRWSHWFTFHWIDPTVTGIIFPIIYYVFGGFYSILFPVIIFSILLLVTFVFGMLEYNFSIVYNNFKLFYRDIKKTFKNKENIKEKPTSKDDITEEVPNVIIQKGSKGVDLNAATSEFKSEEETMVTTIAKSVKENVKKQNEKIITLDKEFYSETKRLDKLKEEILRKKDGQSKKPNYVDPNPEMEKLKQKALLDLGFISPTYGDVRKQQEIKKEPREEKKPSLINELKKDIIDDITKYAINPTKEIPSLDIYADELFDSKIDNALEDATSELVINLGVENDLESTKETIISNISQFTDKKLSLLDKKEFDSSKIELTTETQLNSEKNKNVLKDETINNDQENDFSKEFNDYIEEEAKSSDDVKKNWNNNEWEKKYQLPSQTLLSNPKQMFDMSLYQKEANQKRHQLDRLFENFQVSAKVESFKIGPTVTTFEVSINQGTKITRVTNLEDNIKLTLGVKEVRIQAPIPGKSLIGIEIPNSSRISISFKEVFNQTLNIKTKNSLMVTIGQDVFGNGLYFDLTKAPHMLIAGSTGAGKSVAINIILVSLLLRYLPEELNLVLIDPKMVEFTPYHDIPHLITPVVTEATKANLILNEVVQIMEKRYREMSNLGARNIIELNKIKIDRNEQKIPYIVVIIDELADLMMVASKDVENSIRRITQKARAAGIHMIVATQRPSTDIITGVIKSNIPSRIAFTVASSIDSRTILDATGAEKLIGMGDMMISLYGQLPIRGQGAYISIEEVQNITSFVKKQCKPNYTLKINNQFSNDNIEMQRVKISESDPLYQAAKRLILKQRKASTSLLQRYLNIGYNKAANLIDALEENKIIGPSQGSKQREVLIKEGQNDKTY